VEVSSTQQFTVVFEGEPSQVTWYVNGVRGGSPETGMIRPDGLFVAPSEPPPGGSVTITAEVLLDSLVSESAEAVIQTGYGVSSVSVSPDSASVAIGDSTTFSVVASGCPFADPAWTAIDISPGSGSTGDIGAGGTYVAPALIFRDLELMIMVESPDCPAKAGIAKVVVRQPDLFKVELEDFTASSGSGISKAVPCSGGGFAVNGLDQPGEWIEVPFEIPAGGNYIVEIHYAAGVNDVLTAIITAQGCGSGGSTLEAGFQMAQGNGLG
jgi:hypothetical protein